MSLCLKNLTILNKDKVALFGPLTLEVKPGEVLTLMGPSGCGKSTLLSVIAGHLSDSFSFTGDFTLNGQCISQLSAHQREVGILFQDDLLFPHLSVLENLAFALPNSVKSEQRRQQAFSALENISLASLSESMPEQISGGQRARISLARMLLAKPKLVLLDEPFSKLDKELREQFRDWVFEQLSRAKVPALLVTHDESDVPSNSQCLTWPWSH
ncbi:ATP-binding cassette domain-containing protein [Vibrio algarum]|uniref:ATP-binding cassette domain-containing protein n=1 Tax=Vibrio algarum TaxID=3020714 RepID=A0ABT4YR16_9VIBR|nr:ATP-binding cassette domain-containing protein [Vibrio sp. KJ40-1]MDB1123651.1 ATP-binding cassette domain-containing protein [Vibrio sp. KJ40-1]